MATGWSCSKCGVKVVDIATLCILEEETSNFKDFCFECGMKALKQRTLELGEQEVVNGWHFTVPDLRGKRHACINYLPEVVEYD
ncbi:hypothetical protein ACFLUZ_07220 [Chloroflexota bacterium]